MTVHLSYSSDELLKLVYESGAVSIWDSARGPVYWYAAGIPGPFYVNTESVIGTSESKKILSRIDEILRNSIDPRTRSDHVRDLIMDTYAHNEVLKSVVSSLIELNKKHFKSWDKMCVSGGERRDWIFSIPLAHEMKLPHCYLYKNGSTYIDPCFGERTKAFHVSDLIHNAASYCDLWIPIIERNGMKMFGTSCLITRGNKGVHRLAERGIPASCLVCIDADFFIRLRDRSLISMDKYNEICVFYKDTKEWFGNYLAGNESLFNVNSVDDKSLERMYSFFSRDPWSIEKENENFFQSMRGLIRSRMSPPRSQSSINIQTM